MKKILTILTAFTLLLTACVNEAETKEEEKGKLNFLYPKSLKNDGENVPEARLQYGLASDTPFAGILYRLWYEGNPDFEVMKFFTEDLYLANKDRTYIEGKDGENVASYEMSEDLLTKTITVKKRC